MVRLPRGRFGVAFGGGLEDFVGGVDLDDVHVGDHAVEAGVGPAIAVAVEEHPAEVGVVDLDQFFAGAIPEGEALDLDGGVVVGGGAAAVLLAGAQDEGEGVLVVQRKGFASEFDARAGGHEVSDAESLQVGLVGGDAVMLGAGGELDVLAEQVQDAAELAGRIIAGGAGVAVEVSADPAGGFNGADERGGEGCFLASGRR